MDIFECFYDYKERNIMVKALENIRETATTVAAVTTAAIILVSTFKKKKKKFLFF
jgi:hypothetical protein